MAYELIHFGDAAGLAKKAAANWLSQLEQQARRDDTETTTVTKSGRRITKRMTRFAFTRPYTVALSGGRITKSFFEEIVEQVRQRSDGLENVFRLVHFFWADERCVPPTDPESNYAMARELLFNPLKIPDQQIHRLRGEGPEPDALKEAISDICSVAPMSNGQPVLDMVFLGMGENGHIASLFPEETEPEKTNPAIYRAVTTVKPPPRRLTLGYAAIAAAREVWVLISGTGKEEALKQSLPPISTTPLARVMSLRADTTIYTDIETGLKKS